MIKKARQLSGKALQGSTRRIQGSDKFTEFNAQPGLGAGKIQKTLPAKPVSKGRAVNPMNLPSTTKIRTPLNTPKKRKLPDIPTAVPKGRKYVQKPKLI